MPTTCLEIVIFVTQMAEPLGRDLLSNSAESVQQSVTEPFVVEGVVDIRACRALRAVVVHVVRGPMLQKELCRLAWKTRLTSLEQRVQRAES